FYRFVEPTGATPFSKPARDRALHAVLTAVLRQRAELFDDKDAIYFDKEYFSDTITEIADFITDRIQAINTRADNGMKDDIADVREEMELFFNEWQKAADDCNAAGDSPLPFYFGWRYIVTPPAAGQKRLLKQYNSSGRDVAFETLTSMRNIDSQVNGEIVIWED
ncbi:MAG: helicase, partial [Defluviitaleaceae bacterium]|nr:helicase [Defluviitaleaceae bacterium]